MSLGGHLFARWSHVLSHRAASRGPCKKSLCRSIAVLCIPFRRATGRDIPVRALTPTHSASAQATDRRRLFVQVLVRDNNVDQALKALKKKMQREGIFREMKLRRHYEKPSERRAREAAEAVRRARKLERKRLEREGF